MYNIQEQFIKEKDKASLKLLYKGVLTFVESFKESRHPPTLSWLIEILHIVSIKFDPNDAYDNDKTLK